MMQTILRHLVMVLVMALAMTTTSHAQRVLTPVQIISNPVGPIKQLFLGNDLSVQVEHAGDASEYLIYPFWSESADYGTMVAVDGALYAPDVPNHRGSGATQLDPYTAFTPVSQTAPTGAGTLTDPYQVVTTVNAGTTGIAIAQTDRYVAGQETYRTDITLSNTGAVDKSVLVYRAMDCYLSGDDMGYGTSARGGVSCTANANNSPPGRVMSLIPLTAGSQYEENLFSEIWIRVNNHTPFQNACVQCAQRSDNGIGLSWAVTVPAGGFATVSHLTLFSPAGLQPLTTAKTASPASVAAGGEVSYTITVTNPNAQPVDLDTLVDTLPSGFSYVAGSSQGASTSDPGVSGQNLSWSGPLAVPANNGTLSLTFKAKVSPSLAPGSYTNRVQGSALNGFTVQDSGDTAPVTVVAAVVAPSGGVQPVPALSEWALLLTMAGLAAVAGRSVRRRQR